MDCPATLPSELVKSLMNNKVHIDIVTNEMNELSILHACQVKEDVHKTWFRDHDDLMSIYKSGKRKLERKCGGGKAVANGEALADTLRQQDAKILSNNKGTQSTVCETDVSKASLPWMFHVLVHVAKTHDLSLFSTGLSDMDLRLRMQRVCTNVVSSHVDALKHLKITSESLHADLDKSLSSDVMNVELVEILARLCRTNVVTQGEKSFRIICMDVACDEFVLVNVTTIQGNDIVQRSGFKSFIREKLKTCLLKDIKTLATDLGVPLSKLSEGKRSVLNKAELTTLIENKLK